jgi:hypothetical protein
MVAMSGSRGRKVALVAGVLAAGTLLAGALSWKGILEEYHLHRLRGDAAYVRSIIDHPAGTPARRAVRRFLSERPPVAPVPDRMPDAVTRAAEASRTLDDFARRLAAAGVEVPGGFHRVERKPESDRGSGNYVLALSRGPGGAVLVEVGFQRWSNLCHDDRRLYFIEDREGAWTFLGEGLDESGGHGSWSKVEREVEWTGRAEAPVRIRFTRESFESESQEDWQWIGETVHRDAVLDGPPPASLAALGREYVLAREGDGLDAVAVRLFRPGDPILLPWRLGLLQVNPDLPEDGIPAGTRVPLPTASERDEWRKILWPPPAQEAPRRTHREKPWKPPGASRNILPFPPLPERGRGTIHIIRSRGPWHTGRASSSRSGRRSGR